MSQNSHQKESDVPNGISKGEIQESKITSSEERRPRSSKDRHMLCSICRDLDLCEDRFIIRPSMFQAKKCSPTDSLLMSSTSPSSLGPLKDIFERSVKGCQICTLIILSLKDDGKDGTNIDEFLPLQHIECSIGWQVDGRKIQRSSSKIESVRGFTRRLHFVWSNQGLKDGYLVFVPREKYAIMPSDAERVFGYEQLFMGRKIQSDGGIQARIKSWLDLCQIKHEGPCSKPNDAGRFHKLVKSSFFGVIDVHNMKLTALPADPKPDRFVALSYVWGKIQPLKTTMDSIREFCMYGGIERVLRKLPNVIQDAIDLTQRLGFQYIWIDALCIVQDSARSWKLNAYNMDLIYGNAELTICAADGTDAFARLKAMHVDSHNYNQLMAECAPGVQLMVSRPPEMYIKNSTWSTRAWTFQERLLSRRCLIFTEGRVYFQCCSTGMSEDMFADREGAGWSLDFMDAPMQMFKLLPQRAFWVYTQAVELYTHRQLTKPKDILSAFSGIMNTMQATLNAPFVFGLPSSHFDLALLWAHSKHVERRRKEDFGDAQEYGTTEFPSWAWSGWQGAATTYLSSLTKDCLDNVSEWLNNHTWIKWHIRDGKGRLRPLRDGSQWREDLSEDKRWRGYEIDRSGRRNSTVRVSRDSTSTERRNYPPLSPPLDYGTRTMAPFESQRRKMRSIEPEQGAGLSRSWDTEDDDSDGITLRPSSPPIHSRQPFEVEREEIMGNICSTRDEQARSMLPDTVNTRARNEYTDDRNEGNFYDQIFDNCDHSNVEKIQANPHFHITLPEHPYHVVMAPFSRQPDSYEFPLMPILQFWTCHSHLYIQTTSKSPIDGLVRCHIADSVGDWCGSILLDADWVGRQAFARQEFIALSEAKRFTADECELWTYYIPKDRVQSESEWDLYNVMLIERKDEMWERRGVGKVFKEAFRTSKWKEIMLG